LPPRRSASAPTSAVTGCPAATAPFMARSLRGAVSRTKRGAVARDARACGSRTVPVLPPWGASEAPLKSR
jgi:hypothetical protein